MQENQIQVLVDDAEELVHSKKQRGVSVCRMFRFATCLDYVLMMLGCTAAIATGASIAAFTIILGELFDSLNSVNPKQATNVSLYFVYVGAGKCLIVVRCSILTEMMEDRHVGGCYNPSWVLHVHK